MSYHGKQYATVEKVCACGCGKKFFPVPKYHPKSQGGGKWYPDYIRGHHPNNQKNSVNLAGWNRGMKIGDHPSLARMGFQKGHIPANDWSEVNRRIKEDPEFKTKWLEAKRGKTPWNKGIKQENYPDHEATTTPDNNAKRYDGTPLSLIAEVFKRDNYTCQACGTNADLVGHFITLHSHHIAPVKIRPDLVAEISNLITLCPACHRYAHNGKMPHLIKTD